MKNAERYMITYVLAWVLGCMMGFIFCISLTSSHDKCGAKLELLKKAYYEEPPLSWHDTGLVVNGKYRIQYGTVWLRNNDADINHLKCRYVEMSEGEILNISIEAGR